MIGRRAFLSLLSALPFVRYLPAPQTAAPIVTRATWTAPRTWQQGELVTAARLNWILDEVGASELEETTVLGF